MEIKKINHTRLKWIYSAFYTPDFHKLSLTKHSAEPYKRSTELRQAFEGLRENRKLGRVFEKLGRVFLLQHDPCCPNQSR